MKTVLQKIASTRECSSATTSKDTAVLQVILVEASNICFRKLRDQVEIPFLGFSCALLV